MGFWNQTSKAGRLEANLTLLKEDIASEKRAIASLDRKLARASEHMEDRGEKGGESQSTSSSSSKDFR